MILAVIAVFLFCVATAIAQQNPPSNTARVITTEAAVPLRSGPTDHAGIIRQVPNDTEVTILGTTADGLWYHVRLSNLRAGWISAEFLEFQTVYATPAPSVNDEVLRLINLGSMYLAQEDYGKALPLFNEAIELDGTNAEAFEGRGYIYLAQENYHKALDDFTHAVENGSHNPYLFVSRGYAYEYLEQFEQALADFNHALELSPNDEAIYLARGLVYVAMGDYDPAIADLSEFIRHQATNPQAYYFRGIGYFYKSQYVEALADFSHVVEITPDNAYVYGWRGFTYAAIGGSEEQIRADLCRHVQLAGAAADTNVTDEIARRGWQCSSST